VQHALGDGVVEQGADFGGGQPGMNSGLPPVRSRSRPACSSMSPAAPT
jgi:hypothetical protein